MHNDSSADRGSTPPSRIVASGPTASPWLRILASCAAAAGIVVAVVALLSALTAGPAAALSAVFGAAVVAAFFTLSLLVGHYVGRRNPSGAIGVFLVTYLVKIVGFAAVLYFIGTPGWLNGTWFFICAVAVVLVWQAVEVFVFSRTRHQLFNDPTPDAAPRSGTGTGGGAHER